VCVCVGGGGRYAEAGDDLAACVAGRVVGRTPASHRAQAEALDLIITKCENRRLHFSRLRSLNRSQKWSLQGLVPRHTWHRAK
jgi:hypothetical protein